MGICARVAQHIPLRLGGGPCLMYQINTPSLVHHYCTMSGVAVGLICTTFLRIIKNCLYIPRITCGRGESAWGIVSRLQWYIIPYSLELWGGDNINLSHEAN